MHTAAHTHLTDIALDWPALQDLLPAGTGGSSWPPTRKTYLRELDAADREDWATRSVLSLGERPVPLRLDVLDTMRAVEAALVDLADQIAADVQRPAMTVPTNPHGWTAGDLARRRRLAHDDATDPRRWRWTGTRRTAPQTALWLAARVADQPGPFRPLTEIQHDHIAAVARGAADRIGRLLGTVRFTTVMDQPCPWCAGHLGITTGGPADGLPTVVCRTGPDCTAPVPLVAGRRTWARAEDLASLERTLVRRTQQRAWRDAKRLQRAHMTA